MLFGAVTFFFRTDNAVCQFIVQCAIDPHIDPELTRIFQSLQVVEESSLRYDHGCEDPKYYIVKAEWFWTRIAEGLCDFWSQLENSYSNLVSTL